MNRKVATIGTRQAHAVMATAWVGTYPSKAEKKIVPSTATPSALRMAARHRARRRRSRPHATPTPARMKSNS